MSIASGRLPGSTSNAAAKSVTLTRPATLTWALPELLLLLLLPESPDDADLVLVVRPVGAAFFMVEVVLWVVEVEDVWVEEETS